ncbi:hypothetical protein DSM16313_24260 [Acinetobacter seohaensis]|nr:hypothetical protein DSM16313_24260 [Acinetobacter seohaensis]
MTTNTSHNKLVERLIKRQDKKRFVSKLKSFASNAAASALIAVSTFIFFGVGLKACEAEQVSQVNATKAHLEAMR